MINVDEQSRIIGDFIEINADILYMRQTSKYPKFIADLIAKFNHNRLLKSVKKIKENGVVLSKDNLFELFIYIFNNFPPEGKYNSIYKVLCVYKNEDISELEAIVKFDNINCIINIEKDRSSISITVREKISETSSKEYSIDLDRLFTDNPKTKEIIHRVNNKLLEEMTSFILSIVSNYN